MKRLFILKVYKKLVTKFSDINIVKKMILSFVFVIVVPLFASYHFSQKTSSNIIVKQVCGDTLSSMELVKNSIDNELNKMISAALFLSEDENIKDLIKEEGENNELADSSNNGSDNWRKLEKINKVDKIFNNIIFNTMGTKCYMTLMTVTGTKYTNWSYEDARINKYFEKFNLESLRDQGNNLIWKGIETNYVSSDMHSKPYILTLVKNIADYSGTRLSGVIFVSVPENEISKLMSPTNQVQQRFMVDENMNIISSTQKEWLNKSFRDVYDGDFPPNGKGYFIANNGIREKSVITYCKFKNRNWNIIDIKSYTSITNELVKSKNSLVAFNLIFVAVFIAIAFIIARGITTPLRKLTNMMLNADLSISINEQRDKRKDEIGILENSFHVMRENIITLINENKIKEKKKRDAELKALQAQISPHFLFNTLNAVRWAAINKDNKRAADMVFALSSLLQMTLVKGDELITLEQEILNLKYYTDILKKRHSKVFEIVYNIDEDLIQYKIPKLLLQPLVENAILHGFEDLKSGGIIEISGFTKNDEVVIYIKDNGKGMTIDSIMERSIIKDLKFSGIGISNVDERIKLYYGNEYGLSIESSPDKGTIIVVTIPKTVI